jgi:hypothetical protein
VCALGTRGVEIWSERDRERVLERRLKKTTHKVQTHTHTQTQTQTQIHASALPLYSPTAHSLTTCVFRPHRPYIYIPPRTTSYLYCVCQPASQAKPASHSSQRARAEGAVRSGPRKRKSVGGKFSLEKIRNKSAERGRNLSRSWHKGHSHTYNTLF